MHYDYGGTRNIESGTIELVADVQSERDSNNVLLTLRCRRIVSGYDFTDRDGKKKVETSDSAEAPKNKGRDDPEWREIQGKVSSIFVGAMIDGSGHLIVLDPNGQPLDLRPDRGEMPKETEDCIFGSEMLFALPALLDSLAYVPPPDVQMGTAWTVRREIVFPGHSFGYGMLVGGGLPSEDSVCRCWWIERTPGGRIAQISISGTRRPGGPPGRPMRVPSLTVSGRLQFNLDTGRVRRLRVESRPRFSDPNDAAQFQVRFVDTLSTENLP